MTVDPFDQPDGFHDSNEDWAKREAMGAYDDVWDFMFSLEKLSQSKDWDAMRRDLSEFKGKIPWHNFSEMAFCRAAEGGQADIVAAMLSKGFSPQGDAALERIAERGTPGAMEALRKAGCDVLIDGAAFSFALHAGNKPMMQYFYDQGADIYTPSAVKGLYGGIESFQAENPKSVAGPAKEARAFHASLCDVDATVWGGFYTYIAASKPDMDDLRLIPHGVRDEGLTMLQIAARGGLIEDAIEIAAREKADPVTADDLLRPAASGASVLSVLAARGEAHKVFDARLWWNRPEEAEKLRNALKDWGAENAFDAQAFAAAMQRQRLKETAPAIPRLKPRRP